MALNALLPVPVQDRRCTKLSALIECVVCLRSCLDRIVVERAIEDEDIEKQIQVEKEVVPQSKSTKPKSTARPDCALLLLFIHCFVESE